jgi:hypothetical protein
MGHAVQVGGAVFLRKRNHGDIVHARGAAVAGRAVVVACDNADNADSADTASRVS